MAEVSKIKWAWDHRRGIGAFAIVTALSLAAAPHMGEHDSQAASQGDGGGNYAPHRERGDFTNRNPAGELACRLTLTQQGPHDTDPYTLQAYVTNGTPPKGATLTYRVKHQAGLNGHFKNFRQDPVTVPWDQPQTLPAEAFPPDGGTDPIPLGSVSGKIAGTTCASAIAGEGQ